MKMKHHKRTRSGLLGMGIMAAAGALAIQAGCANVEAKEPSHGQTPGGVELVGQTQEAVSSGPATDLASVWTENFDSVRATAGCRDGAYGCAGNNLNYWP
jgi:hypothetical protein